MTVNGSYADSSGAGSYAENVTVTIQAGSRENYTFNGWTVTAGNVSLTDASSTTTTFTMPAENVTVTANWQKDEPIPAGTITVTPADIIIYMGGKPYEGAVDESGNTIVSNQNAGLPEPGFVFTLPDGLASALAQAGQDITDVTFQECGWHKKLESTALQWSGRKRGPKALLHRPHLFRPRPHPGTVHRRR